MCVAPKMVIQRQYDELSTNLIIGSSMDMDQELEDASTKEVMIIKKENNDQGLTMDVDVKVIDVVTYSSLQIRISDTLVGYFILN